MADISLEKTLPNNLEAERSVLGAVLLDDKAFISAFESLKPEDFYVESHRKIFERMIHLLGVSRPIDLITLKEELQKANELETVGGAAYLAGLTDGLPRALNIEHYSAIVKEKSTLRRLIRASNEIMSRSYRDDDTADEILQAAEKAIFDIAGQQFRTGFSEIAPIVGRVYDEIKERASQKSAVTGLETGFKDLDRITSGLHPSDLIIVAARPGLGKTSLCLNIATHAAIRKKKSVGIFSLEMSEDQLVKRFLSSEARIDQSLINKGFLNKDNWSRLDQVRGDIAEAAIHIDDTVNVPIAELRTKARRLSLEKGLDLLIIDYLQLMSGNMSNRYENRTQEIAQISRGLKGIAKELNIPVIAVSQLSRAVESRRGDDKRPKLSDLRESGSIEQDADIVMFIYREDAEDPSGEKSGTAELIIAKHRNGSIGTVPVAFSPMFTKFDDLYQE